MADDRGLPSGLLAREKVIFCGMLTNRNQVTINLSSHDRRDNMIIPTIKKDGRKGDDSDYQDISLEDVLYIDLWRRTRNSDRVLAFHTSTGVYLGLSTLADAYRSYRPYGFELVARSVLINRNKIEAVKVIENGGSIVTFKDGSIVQVRKQL